MSSMSGVLSWKKYDSLFSLVFNPLEFPVDQLNEVQITRPEHLAHAECNDMKSKKAIKYLYENWSLIRFWGSEDCKKFPSL
jgi:hypothetical protein